MARPSKFSPDFRARARGLVAEARPEHDSEWAAITSVASRLGLSGETLRKWIRQAEIDDGQRAGTTTDESVELKRLRRENTGRPTQHGGERILHERLTKLRRAVRGG